MKSSVSAKASHDGAYGLPSLDDVISDTSDVSEVRLGSRHLQVRHLPREVQFARGPDPAPEGLNFTNIL
jgi:hypothetical protein